MRTFRNIGTALAYGLDQNVEYQMVDQTLEVISYCTSATPGFETICVDPDERFQSAAEFRLALLGRCERREVPRRGRLSQWFGRLRRKPRISTACSLRFGTLGT